MQGTVRGRHTTRGRWLHLLESPQEQTRPGKVNPNPDTHQPLTAEWCLAGTRLACPAEKRQAQRPELSKHRRKYQTYRKPSSAWLVLDCRSKTRLHEKRLQRTEYTSNGFRNDRPLLALAVVTRRRSRPAGQTVRHTWLRRLQLESWLRTQTGSEKPAVRCTAAAATGCLITRRANAGRLV